MSFSLLLLLNKGSQEPSFSISSPGPKPGLWATCHNLCFCPGKTPPEAVGFARPFFSFPPTILYDLIQADPGPPNIATTGHNRSKKEDN